jgi:Protein kinase domain
VIERRLGSRYVLIRPLGRGGMGEVYRARVEPIAPVAGAEAVPAGDVAVKVLREDLTADPDHVTRFLREGRLLRSVDHPNVVRIRDLVAEGSTLAIVMDLMEGGDLRQVMTGPCAEGLAARIVAAVAEGLAAVHAAGIVHRDLKPGNVLVECGPDRLARPRISDFGISRLDTGGTAVTLGTLGTIGYMAPELVHGERAMFASDVYALGVLLYELCTGYPPFRGEHEMAVIRAHVQDPVPRPADMSLGMWRLVESMLAKSPSVRPSAREVAGQLDALVGGGRTASSVPPGWFRLPPTSRPAGQGPGPVPATDVTSSFGDLAPTAVAGPRAWTATTAAASEPGARPRAREEYRDHPRWTALAVTAAAVAIVLGAGALWMGHRAPSTGAKGAPASSVPATVSSTVAGSGVPSGTTTRPDPTADSPGPSGQALVGAATLTGQAIGTTLRSGTSYTLLNAVTGKCLGRVDGQILQQPCGAGTPGQGWTFEPSRIVGASLYRLRDAHDEQVCLDVPDVGSVPAGTRMQAVGCPALDQAPQDNDEFTLVRVGADGDGRPEYAVVNHLTGLCLDVSNHAADGSDRADNLAITLFTCQDSTGDWDDHLWIFS